MRHWFLPLLASAVLFQASAGRTAEPPATCKLDLVRLEPLPPGEDLSQKQWLFRSARDQPFGFFDGVRRGATHEVDKEFEQADKRRRERFERDFRETVRKQPEKYCVGCPFRATAAFGGRKYGFVLDKQSEKSQGYDRLYFDLNGNGDLTDDVPIDVPDEYKTADSAKSGNGWTRASYRFPRADFKICAEGAEWDYSFFLWTHTDSWEGNVQCGASFLPAAYRQGEITLQGTRRKIVLVDWTTSGRFDVPVGFAADGKGIEGFFAQYGTQVLFDPDYLINNHLDFGYTSEHRQFLGKMNALGGRFYKIQVRPGGDELTCMPVDVAVGTITSPHAPCNVWLIGEQGFLDLDLQRDIPAEIPAGRWRLLSYTFWCAEERARATEQEKTKSRPPSDVSVQQRAKDAPIREDAGSDSPVIRCLSASCGRTCAPVRVAAGRNTMLKIGPPYTATLAVKPKQNVALPGVGVREVANLGLEIRGIGKELVGLFGGSAFPMPALTITDPQGKVVERGNFGAGGASTCQYWWQVPAELALCYTIDLKVDFGPFQVKDPGSIVIDRSQLEPAKDPEPANHDAIGGLGSALLCMIVVLVYYHKIRKTH